MELTQLKYFYETARLGTLTKASENLNIAVSAISRQINLLEEEIGQQLFIRSRSGLTLTTAGADFYDKAKRIINLCQEAVLNARDKVNEIIEPLFLGFMDDTFSGKAPRMISEFKTAYNKINLSFYGGVHKNLFERIQKNKLDAAFMYFYNEPEGYESIFTGVEKRFGIIMHEKDELAKYTEISIETLNQIPLIVPETDDLNRDRIKELPYDKDSKNIIAKTDNPFVFQNFVLDKQAYMFVIEPIIGQPKYEPLTFRPIASPIRLKLYLIVSKIPPHLESASAFMRFAHNFFDS